MTEHRLAAELRALSGNLETDGWDRLRSVHLADVADQILAEYQSSGWTEVIGRAGELRQVLSEFIREAPSRQRLEPVLRAALGLADLLERGRYCDGLDPACLPAVPGDWTFLVADAGLDEASDRLAALRALGFRVEWFPGIEGGGRSGVPERTILLAGASWLTAHAQDLQGWLRGDSASPLHSPTLVAVVAPDDLRAQAAACRAGAHLLIEAPLQIGRLVVELAGLAWMPRSPYRILLFGDHSLRLADHADWLGQAGCEVWVSEDPATLLDLARHCAPEVCALDLHQPASLVPLLHHLLPRGFARLPIIDLSPDPQNDHPPGSALARLAMLPIAPLDPRLRSATLVAQARQFRLLQLQERREAQAWRELTNLKDALDRHAIVSVTDPDGAILDVNSTFCEISGYRRDELIGRNHRLIRSAYHPPALFEEMWRTIASGCVWQGEVRNRRRDGSPYWAQATIVPILDEQGRPERYISIRTDITEQKQLLAERERQVRLLELQRQALQHFIATQDIATTSALLLDGMLILTDSAYGFIGEVLHEADGTPYVKTHAVTNIAWNDKTQRLYAAAQVQGMEFRNLHTLFGAVLQTGEPVIANHPAEDPRRGHLPDGHAPLKTFLGVPIHHGELLIGMVGLANRPGGYDASLVEFLQGLTATYANLLEATRLKRFQRFVIDDLQTARDLAERENRARNDFLTTWSNTLRATLDTILRYAHRLATEPTLGEQARQEAGRILNGGGELNRLLEDLSTWLAAEPATEPPTRPAASVMAESDHPAGRRRVLVAEDSPTNRTVLRMQLEVLGYEADLAVDGSVALSKWQAGGHDLILADRLMPGMDGLALTRSIRAAERDSGRHIPIIAITAAQHPDELRACRESGMDDVLPKPIGLDDLRRVLDHWLPAVSAPDPSLSPPMVQAGHAGAILDLVYLRGIVGPIPPPQIRELVDLFTATARVELTACRYMRRDSDARSLALAMHRLKSSARMVGALHFSTLAERLEEIARTDHLDSVPSLLAELEHAVGDVELAAQQLGLGLESLPEPPNPSTLPPEVLPRRALVVDDDPIARRQGSLLLTALGVGEVLMADGGEAALAELAQEDADPIDLLITDLKMPGMDGIAFLRRLAEKGYPGYLIISSGVEEQLLETAADLIRAKGLQLRGAIRKPMTRDDLTGLLTAPCERTNRPVQPIVPDLSPRDILQGIHRDEFSMHFQPKVDTNTLRVVGVEALARWRRGDRLVPPDRFIGAAERHGLIVPLSQLLLVKTLSDVARLAAVGFPLGVAFNLSANWLSDIDLPEFIQDTLQAFGLAADRLILEITETGIMADLTTSLDVLTRLRLKGFKLSIDDFGTGYSSIDQLRRIPFGELKLDRGFVRGATDRPTARAILASSIDMAHKLRLTTVAEGVETESDLDLVRGLGCDLVQGWLIAKPMPMEDLIVWLQGRVM